MIRKFISLIITLCVLAALAFYLLANVFVGKTLEQILGTSVKVKRLHLGLLSSEIGIYGLRVGNPPGFKEKTLASVPEIYLSYDLKGLLNKKIHIKSFRLNLDEITVERIAGNKFNLTELKAFKAPKTKPGQQPAPPPSPEKAPGKQVEPFALQIDEVHLSLGRARYVDTSGTEPLVKELSLGINDAVLRDVTDPNQVVQQIIAKTMQRVGLNSLLTGGGDLTEKLKTEANSLKENFSGLIKKLKSSANGGSAPAK